MILESKVSEIVTSTNFQELEFGIKQSDMGLILEILRSKMYKNPIGAICREISSNSRDANREAKNNIPIEISITSSKFFVDCPIISFRDFGPGISKERMADVFVNYGASTKRDSNDQTGGFGLGAKTPFSYTDNFSIETIVNGIKYTYIAAIEDGKKGKLYLFSSEETTEHSGTTIIIPIKDEDRASFEKEVIKATIFWDTKPVYKNFKHISEFTSSKAETETEKFLILNDESEFFGFTFGILLDNILYNLDTVQTDIIDRYHNTNKMIIFKFNTGDLTISANRESLQYDKKTIETIKERNIEFLNFCQKSQKESIESCKSWFEAFITYNKNSFFLIVLNRNSIKPVDHYKDKKLSFYFSYLMFVSRKQLSNGEHVDFSQGFNKEFFDSQFYLLDDCSKINNRKEKTIFKNVTQYVYIKARYEIIHEFKAASFSRKKELAKQLRETLKQIESLKELGIEYKLYSTVEKAKIERTSSDIQKESNLGISVKIFKVSCFGKIESPCRRYSRRPSKEYTGEHLNIKANEIESFDKNIYCYQEIDDIRSIPREYTKMYLLKCAVELKYLNDFSIIYVNKHKSKLLKNHFQSFEQKCNLLTVDIIRKIINTELEYNFLDKFSFLKAFEFKSKKYSELKSNLSNYKKQTIYLSESIKNEYKHLNSNILGEFKIELEKNFPLLTYYHGYSSNTKNFNDYFNLVEQDLINKKLLQ
jgi:hypothetical protein